MSLWWSKQLRLVVAPDHCALIRASGSRREADRVRVLPPALGPEGLKPLAACLGEPEWRTSSVDIVVSNRYVHYTLSEPPGRLLKAEEEMTLARAGFRAIFGETANRFRVRAVSQPPDAGVLSAALDESLAQALEGLMKDTGVTRYRMRTLLDAAVNQLPAKDGWWVLAEPGWICMLLAERGAWRHVSAYPAGQDWTEQLADRLERSTRLISNLAASRKVWLHAVNCAPPSEAGMFSEWDVEFLGDPLMPTGGWGKA